MCLVQVIEVLREGQSLAKYSKTGLMKWVQDSVREKRTCRVSGGRENCATA